MARMSRKFLSGPGHVVLLMLAGWMNRQHQAVLAYQKEENRVLREMLGGGRLRFTDAQRRRLALKAKSLSHATLRELGSLVTPDTLTRWFRKYAGAKYDSSARRRRGRPSKPEHVRELVVRLAQENVGWGYTKIRDVMALLGHKIGRTTVRRILDADGIEPAPERLKHMPWATFLKAHWGAIAAMDFFQIEVMTLTGPTRYAVLVVIDLKSRRVEVAGIVRDAYEEWMIQVIRNLTDNVDGFLLPHTHLIMDRDPLFTADCRAMLKHSGVKPLRLPRRSPNLNAYVERFFRSIKEECLERVVPLGEAHLRELVSEYVAHYNAEPPQPPVGGELSAPAPNDTQGWGDVETRERLGGLLNHYYREAA
jgi:putative transposase